MKSPEKPNLKNGAASGRGGYREGSGRSPDWLKEKCKEIVDKKNIVEFIGNVAAGMIKDADVKDRLRASEMLLDRAWGKPVQSVDHSGEIEHTHRVINIVRSKGNDGAA